MFKVIPRAAIGLMAASVLSFLSFLSTGVLAQAEVVDPIPVGGNRSTYNAASKPSQAQQDSSQISAEFYYQFQALQQEVMQLRGLVEEQAHEIKKLKQQRLDDYLDLDRRLSNLRGGANTAGGMSSGGPQSTPPVPSIVTGTRPAPADELKQYRAAIDLLLKQQDQNGAITALNQHLQTYPKGRYAANAQYWLGEIYLLKGELDQASKWFKTLITEYPGHNKAPDAKFKLAKVYDLQGEKDQARRLLEEVVQSGSSSAKLAQDYLDNKL